MSTNLQVCLVVVLLVLQKSDGKDKKKQFREAICRLFVAQLKPYYQAGKFKSNVSVFGEGQKRWEGVTHGWSGV